MPQRGAPSIITLALVFASGVAIGACRRQPTDVQPPENQLVVVEDEAVDTPMVCVDGCNRLERCIPELASEIDGDPTVVAERLANECAGACGSFGDRNAALALADCLNLGSCEAYWGCVGTAAVRPWLAAVAPVGERTCANLCAQASVCAMAKVCESAPVAETRGQGEGEDPPKRPRPEKKPKDGKDGKPDDAGVPVDEPATDPACAQDRAQLDELEAHCVLQCEATPVDSRARTELIGCIDHASCDGLLRCLDTWSETDYADVDGPTPGISETCDAFCTRAIVCGAQQHDAELDPIALEELKQAMTSTYVECAVQWGKDLEVNGEAARANFERCTAVASCTDFSTCADEV